MNIKEIVSEWLEYKGFDGLYNYSTDEDKECSCHLDNLMPCDDYKYYHHCAPSCGIYFYPDQEE
ncbi:MAG: hypothetical protein LBQ52_04510 [Helicobacteraceae bacterium]|jgi:nitrate/TMAO reductase-like tetraheme cytochrome c subunit|nr:hypothetical protein [Helicobacteraceae bacterium]